MALLATVEKTMRRLPLASLLLCLPQLCSGQVPESARILDSTFGKSAPEVIELNFPATDLNVLAGGHIQGIQVVHDPTNRRYLAFVSHDSVRQAYVVVAAFADAARCAPQLSAFDQSSAN